MTEEGKGHILYNDIYGMEWGGVDIRNGGNPVVSNNWIRDGHADGIVIGEGGKGIIMDNDIRGSLNFLVTVQSIACMKGIVKRQCKAGSKFYVCELNSFNEVIPKLEFSTLLFCHTCNYDKHHYTPN